MLLEPDHPKIKECLRLLQAIERRTPIPGLRGPGEDFALVLEPDPPPPQDVRIDKPVPPAPAVDPLYERPSPEDLNRDLGSLDLDNREWAEAMQKPAGVPAPSTFLAAPTFDDDAWATEAPLPGRSVWPPPPDEPDELIAPDIPQMTSDPLDFAAASDPAMISTTGGDRTPWDEGPSRTSVVTLDDRYEEFDAVAEPTPLPDIDKERFFGRVQDDGALVEYMRSTGDLMIRRAPTLDLPQDSGSYALDMDDPAWKESPSGEIVFEDAVEMAPSASPKKEKRRTPEQILSDAKDRMSLHDFQGVIELVEQIPAHQRSDEANKLRASCRMNLLKMYESKIGPTDGVPKVRLSSEEVIWLNLNHRAGFILSQIDGSVTYEDLIALSGMDRLDTVRILAELITQKVIKST